MDLKGSGDFFYNTEANCANRPANVNKSRTFETLCSTHDQKCYTTREPMKHLNRGYSYDKRRVKHGYRPNNTVHIAKMK